MTSSINPNNIDGAYPVAGQDNDSQGFRDNFTNTKTNFTYARDEISDLQSKVILKSALVGTTLDNNLGGSLVQDGRIQDFSLTRVVQTATSGTININYAAGHYHKIDSTTGSVDIAFSNFPVAGYTGILRLQIVISSSAHTLTLPSAVSINATGITGLVGNIITFASPGTYEFEFVTSDNGSSITISQTNSTLTPFNASGGTVSIAGSTIPLGQTTTLFQTAGAETSTLADGVNGQIVVLICEAYVGNMVTTVTNAGWNAGSGTVTFNNRGDTCTLMYQNTYWWVIANNGCVIG